MATVPDDDLEGTFAELLQKLGGIPAHRILMKPPPGTATEKDVLAALEAPRKRICELIDGALVEKPVSTLGAALGGIVFRLLGNHVEEHDLGLTVPADGPVRLFPGRVRYPDASFISWARLPEGHLPDEAVAGVAPDLTIEVISPGNTRDEMTLKLRDYFLAGVREAWLIYPKTQTAEVYTAPDQKRRIPKSGALDGGAIVPGFRLSLADLFARMNCRKRA
jgi:Uma2 family endonuclease